MELVWKWKKVYVSQSCQTPYDPMDYSLPGSSVHGILQARILERVAISFSRGSSWPRDQTQVSCIADRFFTVWANREALVYKTCLMDSKLHKHNIWSQMSLRKHNYKQS